MIRTFVAIRLPQDVIAQLAELSERLKQDPGGAAGRWVRPENIHLTLKFLDDVAEETLVDVFQAVDRVCSTIPPLPIELAGLGCFPNKRRPRVVWVGLEDKSGHLVELAGGIDTELAPLGFARETRPFRPHLTLARIRRNASRKEAAQLGATANHSSMREIAAFTAETVHVVRSELGRGGAHYTNIHRAQLLGGTRD